MNFMSYEKDLVYKIIRAPSRYLWFLNLTYTVVMLTSNWFASRFINLFSFDMEAGVLIFPLTFLLSDLVTEVYGFKNARRVIWCGFLFNILFVIYGQIVVHLPSPEYVNNEQFNLVFSISTRIIIANCISYLIAEPLNSYLMANLKIKMKGRLVGVRFILATVIASGTDSVFFCVLAFYNVLPTSKLGSFILTLWVVKGIIEILLIPWFVFLASRLKKIEKIDMYDRRTGFTFFSLNVDYERQDNQYTEK
jgi:queuosine precursor transporter